MPFFRFGRFAQRVIEEESTARLEGSDLVVRLAADGGKRRRQFAARLELLDVSDKVVSSATSTLQFASEARTQEFRLFISSIGIYAEPLQPLLKPYRESADLIEASDPDYTIIPPTWFTDAEEVDYEITRKGEAARGSQISQKSLATFIARLIEAPENFIRENVGINKPNS